MSGKPGPSPPSPSPPSPPSPPPSPPSPSSGHYEKPPCQSDEVDAQIQGIDGDACVPKCDATGSCPTDKPAGTLAKPMCALQDQSGDHYCALVCLADFMSADHWRGLVLLCVERILLLRTLPSYCVAL